MRLPFEQVLAVTALAGGLLTVAIGVFGRYPFALAGGLGLNAYAAAEVAAHRLGWSSRVLRGRAEVRWSWDLRIA